MKTLTPILFTTIVLAFSFGDASEEVFKAGASVVDVSPKKLPAIRNGGFLQTVWSRNADPLYARSLVLEDGNGETIVLCVVDSCMLPTDICDAIKALVTERTEIPRNRILISATHTHSAPSTMAMCLGTSKDEEYSKFLIPKVAEGIVAAKERCQPARAGWASIDASEFTNCRRWIFRSDKTGTDPFGERTVRAMMHPGYENPTTTGPAGPIDPELSVFSVVSAEADKPIAVLTNFSMHYFGGTGAEFSADYFGELANRIEADSGGDAVAIVSQGTSGDLHWMDYSRPKRTDWNRSKFVEGLASLTMKAIAGITYREDIDLAMNEKRIPLKRRAPSEERLAWAKPINEKRNVRPEGERRPENKPEVYAEQADWISENIKAEVVLQALRIGDLAITALPNEVYGITGLKLKQQSPLDSTFNIELANGAMGYIPPPEQHALGGYTTWSARTAGLEVEAEPKIVATVLDLLETVTGSPPRPLADSNGPYADAVLADNPAVYWRLEDFNGPEVRDAVGKGKPARFEDGIAFHLPGVQKQGGAIAVPPETPSPFSGPEINRAAHFAGGRIVADLPEIDREYSVSFWFWNSFPTDARPVTGYLFSRGENGDRKALGEHIGIGGTSKDTSSGQLFFYTGNGVGEIVEGKTDLAFRDWHQVTLVRKNESLRIYLDGQLEIEADAKRTLPGEISSFFIGGRCDNFANFEGKIDEVAIFGNALTEKQIATHFAASRRKAPAPGTAKRESDPLEPSEAIKTIRVPEGFTIDLVASEPELLDPVAFDWDSRGRLWVVEMADYPLGLGEEGAAGGRVRLLEDRDRDGRYEHSTLFAEGLNFPNGILTWRDGVIVTAAPDVIFLRDTSGDGKADSREVLLTGLTEGNQQLRANGLRWGLDNWVYVAAGGHHGKYGVDTAVQSNRTGEKIKVGSRDFRFKPDTGEVEPQSGPSQFGRNRDNWGNWFGTQNSRPLWHYVLPDQYLRRNPHYAPPEGRVLLPAKVNPPVFPAKPPQKRFHGFDQSGHFTSACSGMIYRDDRLFPARVGDDYGWETLDAFSCEPFHNLVQHIGVTRSGSSFEGKRLGGEGEPDFLAGTDRWFRPVMARTGPDGALWIADMYRYMIEHPQWLPEEGKEALLPHYRQGDDRGRIYRVRRSNDPIEPVPNLKKGDPVSFLASSNGWLRDKAQQIILWRKDPTVIPRVKELAATAPDPETRVQALATLDGLQALAPQDILAALTDSHPGVRSNALRFAEKQEPTPALEQAIFDLVDDPDATVRLQCAFTLGEMEGSPAATSALANWLTSDDPFVVAAASSSLLPHFDGIVESCPSDASVDYRKKLAEMALSIGKTDAFRRLALPLLSNTPDSLILFELLQARDLSLADLMEHPELKTALVAILKSARETLQNNGTELSSRLDAAALLARNPADRDISLEFLEGQIASLTAPADLAQVFEALHRGGDSRASRILLDNWSGFSPEARARVTDLLLSRQDWTGHFLDAIENDTVRPAEISLAMKTRLGKHSNRKIRERANTMIATFSRGTRAEAIAAYASALRAKGDPEKGLPVFQKACLACHKHGAIGVSDVGPDLTTVIDHPAEKLLANILDPNLDIQPGYHAYNCELKNGEQLFGLIAGETASAITLKMLDGSSRKLLRTDIEVLKSADISLMPEGLESAVTIEEMSDLIAFLKTKRE